MINFKQKTEISLYCPFCCKRGSTNSHYIELISQYQNKSLKDKDLLNWKKQNDPTNKFDEKEVSIEEIYFYSATCLKCHQESIYVEKDFLYSQSSHVLSKKIFYQKCIYPENLRSSEVPEPSEFMPDDVKEIYNEAASVFDRSLRASGTLIRITLEQLLKNHTDANPKNTLNIMIGQISAHQPEYIEKMMDDIRICANGKAHAQLDKYRQINETENRDDILSLFSFINLICEQMGVIEKMDEIYDKIPESKKANIKKRDQKFRDK